MQIPEPMQAHFSAVTEATDRVCTTHLNQEYADKCRELTACLCRKSPSPLLSGSLLAWAAAITYELGSLNFLSDTTRTPSLPLQNIAPLYGVSASATASKVKQIRELLGTRQFDPRWTLPSLQADIPLVPGRARTRGDRRASGLGMARSETFMNSACDILLAASKRESRQ